MCQAVGFMLLHSSRILEQFFFHWISDLSLSLLSQSPLLLSSSLRHHLRHDHSEGALRSLIGAVQ